ncbi:asparagine synthetase A [Candidatus Mancarchaeum acidiphilum]|uniref:Asparagine synthetase A n=1 Tax=Candidatus Mancarchaeum acidiphilum TaxID=1920749 RepID=A0A218NMU6_9ARCH|nr:asparagine synthetase A [Candidatus Mancarchaeum acidiphilum]ASI13810.1 asparagine synthetase A [Candidatus Mancarchaeum acidiphilum]
MEESKIVEKLVVTSEVIKHTIDYFNDNGFVQLLPVILGKSTDPLGPDPNSSILKTPEIEYGGQRLYTMNSMILHKQIAIKKLDKIFILSPNIRLEKPERKSSGRHLFEFTQLDFEIRDAKSKDVMALMEGYLVYLSKMLKSDEKAKSAFKELGLEVFDFKPPFKIYSTGELAEKYGEDWEAKMSRSSTQPFWVTDHKREFYEKEDTGRPGHYLNYDLIYPLGFGEALSGGEREHEYPVITRKMGSDRLNMDVYKAYLSEAEKGLYPSAGAGFGVERLTRFLTRSKHVGDVELFRRVPGEEISI